MTDNRIQHRFFDQEFEVLGYLYIGVNDIDASARFYDAILLPLGYGVRSVQGRVEYSLLDVADKPYGPDTVHLAKPFDGKPAVPGNGIMPAFRANSRALVDEVYAAGLAHGGIDEGAPGGRADYNPGVYIAYLRDPVGYKIAVFFKK